MATFPDLFLKATGRVPFPYQERLAAAESTRIILNVPTGSGKTAAAFFSWLWRRRFVSEDIRARTPRRLVYCLPMRVLVEQTRDAMRDWLRKLDLSSEIALAVLMGGEDEEAWDLYPERDSVIVGTQDMLLSRALNRGYAASRARWPIQFGLLNNDCCWLMDEVQLMGPALTTTAQLDAFRTQKFGTAGAVWGIWMSATLQRDWLETVDFDPGSGELVELSDEDKSGPLADIVNANKPLAKARNTFDDVGALAHEMLEAHRPGSRTLAIVNTVRKAVELYQHLEKAKGKATVDAQLVLMHSRFRPQERQEKIDTLLAAPGSGGTVVVSTQVVEAGVDVSARILFTELAPWSSLVQRFGRCNRRGEYKDHDAAVFWIDTDAGDDAAAAPYAASDLDMARIELQPCRDAGISRLPEKVEMKLPRRDALRGRDLVDLFDTTPDLAGNDIDVDRYVRGADESDVRIFWREWDFRHSQRPPANEPAPSRNELCPAPISDFRDFVKGEDRRQMVWRWNFLERTWERVESARIAPGQTFLIHRDAGGYSLELGWNSTSKASVELRNSAAKADDAPESNDDDRLSRIGVWQTIAKHTDEVCGELERIIKELGLRGLESQTLRVAARWHDRGKAHEVFTVALPDQVPDPTKIWAKAAGTWKRYSRPHFRHELASALSVLLSPTELVAPENRDLAAYLAAAHHGKVRLSIRSLPNESHPDGGRRFARGVWDGDKLPETDLGGEIVAPAVTLSLEPMELGLCAEPPFEAQPSWAERMIRVRDRLGPFRLAYLEAIVRAADMRASAAAELREAERQGPRH
jgi:CRISPR-associated endonuclease/helicase Cas3